MKIQNNMTATTTTVGSIMKGTCFIAEGSVYLRGDIGTESDRDRIRCIFLGDIGNNKSTSIAGGIAWFPFEHIVIPVKSATLVIE